MHNRRDFIKRLGIALASFTGGEPLLREDQSSILDLLRARGVHVTVVSNGRRLTEPAVIDLLDRSVSVFELPLLSRRREVHRRPPAQFLPPWGSVAWSLALLL